MSYKRFLDNRQTAEIIAHGRKLDLSSPTIMYIVNLTPDSFSDGDKFSSANEAIDNALSAAENGAAIIDLGAESTRPGASEVPAENQLQKILPVLKELRKNPQLWLSIDTSNALVMERVIAEGADIINDVRSFSKPGALQAVASSKVAVCLMHMQGQPATMQDNPCYENTTKEVEQFLLQRAEQCQQAGINKQAIILDPGFGFGKTLQDNIELINNLPSLGRHGFPLLAGISRKSMLGAITGRDVSDRAVASALAGLLALERGANILRVHDLEANLDALAIYKHVQGARKKDKNNDS